MEHLVRAAHIAGLKEALEILGENRVEAGWDESYDYYKVFADAIRARIKELEEGK